MPSGRDKRGALTSRMISDLMDGEAIIGADSANVRPASLDLSLSDEVYRVDGIFQPRPNETVRQVLDLVTKEKHSLDKPMERGRMYIARLNEVLNLPETIYGFCNPKSTSGRLDIHIRLMADGVPRYDSVTPAGFTGELWVSIAPKTFPVIAKPGLSLNQLRFFNDDTRLDRRELELAVKRYGLIWSQKKDQPLAYDDLFIRDNDDSLILRLDGRKELVGYRGISGSEPVDLSRVGEYPPEQFFEPVHKQDGYIHLKQNEFYILSTREAVKVPPELACEMAPMDERSGEFRSHYAGFIDPGWGYGAAGEARGRPLTLEVRPFEDLIARDKQPIAKIRFEYVTEVSAENYDLMNSNYNRQSGPKLAKQFRS